MQACIYQISDFPFWNSSVTFKFRLLPPIFKVVGDQMKSCLPIFNVVNDQMKSCLPIFNVVNDQMKSCLLIFNVVNDQMKSCLLIFIVVNDQMQLCLAIFKAAGDQYVIPSFLSNERVSGEASNCVVTEQNCVIQRLKSKG